MADRRISELEQIVDQVQPDVDVLAIADVGTNETKKITAADLVEVGIDAIPNGTIPGDKIELNTITGDRLRRKYNYRPELAPDSIDTIISSTVQLQRQACRTV